MDKQPRVVFRNVGQLYFPQIRVECRYSLTPEHHWSSSDWIGIFKVGWSSLRDYHTYTWAQVPEGYAEGAEVDCCALFQAFYLPQPSALEYQFVYVDMGGEVCARSRPFTFCSPKPLDELETLREERDEEDGEEELLMVVPRAQLLQTQLEQSLREQQDMQRALEAARSEVESERARSRRAEEEWERQREALMEEVAELQENLKENNGMLKKIEGKHNDVKYSKENLNLELCRLVSEKAKDEQRIRELEENVRALAERKQEESLELERLKGRMKKMSSQMTHDEEKRKALQAENQAALLGRRELQERLEAGEHMAEGLRRELRERGGAHSQTLAELHQARLMSAQLTLQLSEESLLLQEERASWTLEREACRTATENDQRKLQELSMEVQRQEEWLQEERMEKERLEEELENERDHSRVLLGEMKREMQELKAQLRRTESETEEQQDNEKVMRYVLQLKRRSGLVPEPGEDASCEGWPAEDEEFGGPSADTSSPSTHQVPSSDEEENPGPTPGEEDRDINTPTKSGDDTPAADTLSRKRQSYFSRDERKQLIRPQLDPLLSNTPMW